MTTPFLHVHRVRLEEIDAAGVAYFARYFSWCHDAMEGMLAPLDGGYPGLVLQRHLGFPAVHVEADYAVPLRFGDEVQIAVHVERIGTSSCALRFDLTRAPNVTRVAVLRHVVALTHLDTMRSCPLPTEIRALLERHATTP